MPFKSNRQRKAAFRRMRGGYEVRMRRSPRGKWETIAGKGESGISREKADKILERESKKNRKGVSVVYGPKSSF